MDSSWVWVFVGGRGRQSEKSIEPYVADQQIFRKATAGARAVVMLVGLLQLANSNFEGVSRRKFNSLSPNAYGFAPTTELQF